MKTVTAITAVALAGVASQAVAFTIAPAPTKHWTATGTATSTIGGTASSCTLNLAGKVTATGIGHVTSGNTTGAGLCPGNSLQNLPWTVKATGATTILTTKVTFANPGGGGIPPISCGPNNIHGTLTGGNIAYNNAKVTCSVGGAPAPGTISGSLTTTPTLSIAP
jgi:hypothetical protein